MNVLKYLVYIIQYILCPDRYAAQLLSGVTLYLFGLAASCLPLIQTWHSAEEEVNGTSAGPI